MFSLVSPKIFKSIKNSHDNTLGFEVIRFPVLKEDFSKIEV